MFQCFSQNETVSVDTPIVATKLSETNRKKKRYEMTLPFYKPAGKEINKEGIR